MPEPTNTPEHDLVKLERLLGHSFGDRQLLECALTHKSFGRNNNERLEFLGDAVLGYVIARELFTRYPDIAEDHLTLLRASLVRKETLHEIASEVGLGRHLRLGLGERRSGGRDRASILADALEAVFGAISLDGGFEAAAAVITELFDERLCAARGEEMKDPKTRLQELLQADGLSLPEYEVISMEGSEHQRTFRVQCRVRELELDAEGEGASRRAAEKSAAEKLIGLLDDAV